jgi:DNA repair protein RecN (Recombination protein N)
LIERFYLKDYLSFDVVDMELHSGLVVFTGPSGSGKSILMQSILSSVGLASCEAALCESQVAWELDGDAYGIENHDINVFRHIKKENSRYFVNNQSISRKTITELSGSYLRHISLKDYSDFENDNLLGMLDTRIEKKQGDLYALKQKYQTCFLEHKEVKSALLTIEEEERKIVELKEFALFEIQKIEDINPKVEEDEELMQIKKELSQKEKAMEKIEAANAIFGFEHQVSGVLEFLDIESSFFDDAMNELRAIFDNATERFASLDETNIEEVLNRIEALGNLKRRYGTIEEALLYKERKKEELQKYENIEFTKDALVQKESTLRKELQKLAEQLTDLRSGEIASFCKDLNKYLKELYLREGSVTLEKSDYSLSGQDTMVLKLNNTELQKISTGEFNRLRLAILVLKSEFMHKNGGVLMLDEIDANLSGEESMSVAKVLKQLSKNFQIFVISHQPQLTSMGDQHFLIYKQDNISQVKELKFEQRVDEIARIISGEAISNEAKKFAKELLEAKICAS